MVWPLPKKLRSFILNVNTDPSEELNPAPIPRLPVGFSVSFTSIIIFSGDDPSRVFVSTLLKKPRPRILSTALRILRRLKDRLLQSQIAGELLHQ